MSIKASRRWWQRSASQTVRHAGLVGFACLVVLMAIDCKVSEAAPGGAENLVQTNLIHGASRTGNRAPRQPGPAGVPVPRRWRVDGESADSGFASLVGPAGDVNGDGFDDVFATEPRFAQGKGRVLVYYGCPQGLSSNANWSVAGSLDPKKHQVAGGGDMNKDGYDDLLVASGFGPDSQRQPDAGRVSLYSGSPDGLLREPGWQISAREFGVSQFYDVGWGGDVNGDGHADFVVVTESADSTGLVYRLLSFHGSPSGPGKTPASSWELKDPPGEYGHQVARAGDVNGDGFEDLIVTGPMWSGTAKARGRVFVHHGSVRGLNPTPAWTATYDLPTRKDIDEAYEQFFGWDAAGAGDVNGDGFSDIVIGAPWAEQGDLNEGLAFVYCGSRTGLSRQPSWHIESNHAHALLGWSVSSAGDVNADGYGDVIIGVPNATDGQYNEGAALLFHGAKGGLRRSPAWAVESDETQGCLGKIVASAGDVNGDGCADVLLAAPDVGRNGQKFGRACLYYGRPEGLANPFNYRIDKPVLTVMQEQLDRASPVLKATGVGLLAVTSVALFVAWRRALARLRLSEREKACLLERERIARDLHDELGSGLARLALLKDPLPEAGAEPVSQQVQQALRATEEIVWAVRPANDTLENLVAFLLQQGERMFAGTGIRCVTEAPTLLPDLYLKAEVRKNVFLAAKEAMANALKHGQPTEVRLEVHFTQGVLKVLISDDGVGLPDAPVRRFSNGLRNMRERMESVGGQFEIGPASERGTRVMLRVPL